MFTQLIPSSIDNLTRNTSLISQIGEISQYVVPAVTDERAIKVLERFHEEPELMCIPVLRGGKLCGLINRHRFMENHMVGKFGFGHSLNFYKLVEPLLEPEFLAVDHKTPIEKVGKLMNSRNRDKLYDDICILRNGRYVGVVSVAALLSAIMDNNLVLAIGANPLTGLPGNDFIQREVTRLLKNQEIFDVCYIDIDNFKPFNDRHGFAMGDKVIKAVAAEMVVGLQKINDNTSGFAGHIGGDDFILITTPDHSINVCKSIIAEFEKKLELFHTESELANFCYRSRDRKGGEKCFPLLSLSIAIVSTEKRHFYSYAEMASVASGLKKKAKETAGSIVVRDRRQDKQKTCLLTPLSIPLASL